MGYYLTLSPKLLCSPLFYLWLNSDPCVVIEFLAYRPRNSTRTAALITAIGGFFPWVRDGLLCRCQYCSFPQVIETVRYNDWTSFDFQYPTNDFGNFYLPSRLVFIVQTKMGKAMRRFLWIAMLPSWWGLMSIVRSSFISVRQLPGGQQGADCSLLQLTWATDGMNLVSSLFVMTVLGGIGIIPGAAFAVLTGLETFATSSWLSISDSMQFWLSFYWSVLLHWGKQKEMV